MNASTLTGVYMRMWKGRPEAPITPESNVVWGDLTTNSMNNTYFTNILRNSLSGSITDTTRKIMAIIANVNHDFTNVSLS
ncbi:MAG: hypothetical protein LBU51_08315 [Bacteroidales bacterium]|jgi:hypothetical protein|nr:hypothetical protein [Bacteroidales bacterium]